MSTRNFYQPLSACVLNISNSGNSDIDNVHKYVSKILPDSDTPKQSDYFKGKTLGVGACRRKTKFKTKLRNRKTGLSQKELRNIGLNRLPKSSITYEEAFPLSKIWESYMIRYMNLQNMQLKEWYDPKSGNLWDQMSSNILKADYHFATVKVNSSLCESMVGIEGIIIVDTKFTFQIIGKDDKIRTVPKQSCIFDVYLDKYIFKIFGKYFCIRPSERSTKKTKCSFIPSL